MSFMRFSAAPAGRLGDPTLPWAIFGERAGVPDGLEDSALAGANLALIASTPGAPMFEPGSLFGAHMAGLDIGAVAPGADDSGADAPVVVFVHGYQHEPRRPVLARAQSDNAHRTIYHFDETPGGPGSAEERRLHTTPWFARAMLPDGAGGAAECRGVAVGFCYASRGGSAEPFLPGTLARLRTRLAPRSRREPPAPYVRAYADAETAGHGLAAVLTQLRARLDAAGRPDTPIDIFCHSLGARAALAALALVARRWPDDPTLAGIGRVVMTAGACYWGQAASALAGIARAGCERAPEFYNVTCRADDVLRLLAARAAPSAARGQAARELGLSGPGLALLARGRTIGLHGRPPEALYAGVGARWADRADWADLPLDGARLRRWTRARGIRLRAPGRLSAGDHWAAVSEPRNWALYRAILHRHDGFSARELAAAVG